MKYLKMLGLASVAAMAFMAFAASSASATTLEVGGVTKNESVTITASLKAGTTATLKDTFGISSNTCKQSHVHAAAEAGATEHYTGTVVTGPLTGHIAGNPENGLSFSECERPVKVLDPGTLEVSHITGTTNGTVASEKARVETGSPFGNLICDTEETTHLGTLKGVKEGHATMEINASLKCSGISAKWIATYTITTPTGLGVSA